MNSKSSMIFWEKRLAAALFLIALLTIAGCYNSPVTVVVNPGPVTTAATLPPAFTCEVSLQSLGNSNGIKNYRVLITTSVSQTAYIYVGSGTFSTVMSTAAVANQEMIVYGSASLIGLDPGGRVLVQGFDQGNIVGPSTAKCSRYTNW